MPSKTTVSVLAAVVAAASAGPASAGAIATTTPASGHDTVRTGWGRGLEPPQPTIARKRNPTTRPHPGGVRISLHEGAGEITGPGTSNASLLCVGADTLRRLLRVRPCA